MKIIVELAEKETDGPDAHLKSELSVDGRAATSMEAFFAENLCKCIEAATPLIAQKFAQEHGDGRCRIVAREVQR